MSICSEDYYNPCIRKGKHKPVYKKQKKYEAKAQKKNRIQPLTHKIHNVNTIYSEHIHTKLDDLIKILKECKITEWSSDYEDYYQNHHCYENETLASQYDTLQTAIIQDEYDKYYDDYEDRWERWTRYDRYYDRW
jgi:hypothetical protein